MSSDLVAKANAGDIEAQMFLADYNLDIGEYKQSLYWYMLTSKYPGNHQAKAYNNMGYIFVENTDLAKLTPDYYIRTHEYFQKAIELGSEDALWNEYIFLKSFPEGVFREINYHYELWKVEQKLKETHNFTHELEMYSTGWEKIASAESALDPNSQRDDGDEYISYVVKTETVTRENGVQLISYYDVYKKVDNPIPPPYIRTK